MSKAISDEVTSLSARIEQLQAEVVALSAALHEIRSDLAHEVRTERIVVVHPDDGRELIHTELLANAVSLSVTWLPVTDPRFSQATLSSGNESGGEAYVTVTAAGELLGTFSAVTLLAFPNDDTARPLAARGALEIGTATWLEDTSGIDLAQFPAVVERDVSNVLPMKHRDVPATTTIPPGGINR